MPDCKYCELFNEKLVKCNGVNNSPLRNCVNAFNSNSSKLIEKDFNILEIGCGNNNFIFEEVSNKNVNWYGLDP